MTAEYGAPRQHHFSPYSENGGTVLGIAGEDYAIIASDTRLSEGYSIHSRNVSKAYTLNSSSVFGCGGFHGDALTLIKRLEQRLISFEHIHEKKMHTPAIAQMLSTMLYGRRFFPYYTTNILGGLDAHGKGCIYSFDSVGSYERETYRAGGTASTLLQPLIDNQIGCKNQSGVTAAPVPKDVAIKLVKDVFASAGERDIYTGDSVHIKIITKDGIEEQSFALRKD